MGTLEVSNVKGTSTLLPGIVLLAATAGAADQGSKVDQVVALLSGYEYEASKADFDAVGPEAPAVLMQVASDAGLVKIIRARALLALRYYPGEKTKAFILGVVSAQGQDEMLVRKGLHALAAGFGKNALDDLAPFLEHENPDVREAAARAVGGIACKKALKLLTRRLAVEKNAMVLTVLKEQIAGLKKKIKKGAGK
jgi:hypothetical protein